MGMSSKRFPSGYVKYEKAKITAAVEEEAAADRVEYSKQPPGLLA